MAEPLPPDVRRARMLERIQRNGSASVNELARDYAVSAVTVHRDLELLARDGLVAHPRWSPLGRRCHAADRE